MPNSANLQQPELINCECLSILVKENKIKICQKCKKYYKLIFLPPYLQYTNLK